MKLSEYFFVFVLIFIILIVSGKAGDWLVSHVVENRDFSCFKSGYVRVAEKNYPYRVYIPDKIRDLKNLPVILFLHGARERGSDGVKQIRANINEMVKRLESFPAIVVFPQCPEDSFWTNAVPRKIALAALDSALIKYGSDKNRVYLVGISIGGYGVWSIGAMYTEKFAALVPICGGIKFSKSPSRVPAVSLAENPYLDVAVCVVKLPIWIFHGSKDKVIFPDDSRKMAEVFEKLGVFGANVHYTELQERHNIWDTVLGSKIFWQWLFIQRRK